MPVLEDFEDPRSPRADTAARRAALAAQASQLPDSVKAVMAWFVGQWHLDRNELRAGAGWIRRSCALFPAPPCGPMLDQLKDVP